MNTALTVLIVELDGEEVCEDPAGRQYRADLHARLRRVFVEFGATQNPYSGLKVLDFEGFNWHGKGAGETFFITAECVGRMEAESEEKRRLRAAALAKLTPDERDLLGLYS